MRLEVKTINLICKENENVGNFFFRMKVLRLPSVNFLRGCFCLCKYVSASQKIKKKRNVLERCFRQLALKEMISLTSPEQLLKAPVKYQFENIFFTRTRIWKIERCKK